MNNLINETLKQLEESARKYHTLSCCIEQIKDIVSETMDVDSDELVVNVDIDDTIDVDDFSDEDDLDEDEEVDEPIEDAEAESSEDSSVQDNEKLEESSASTSDDVICVSDPKVGILLKMLLYSLRINGHAENKHASVKLDTVYGKLTLVEMESRETVYNFDNAELMFVEVRNDMFVLHPLSYDNSCLVGIYAVVKKDENVAQSYCVPIADLKQPFIVDEITDAEIEKAVEAEGYFECPVVYYKITKPEHSCKGVKYCGYTHYLFNNDPKIHKQGIHFTSSPSRLLHWYRGVNSDFHVFKVQVPDDAIIVSNRSGDIFATDDIIIGEEIPMDEVTKLVLKSKNAQVYEELNGKESSNISSENDEDSKKNDILITYAETTAQDMDSLKNALLFEDASPDEIEGLVVPTAFGDLIAVHVPYNRLDDVINLCNSDEFPLSFWPARLNDTKINIIHDFVLSEGLHVVLRKNQILSHQYEVPMSRAVFTTSFKTFNPERIKDVYKNMKEKERFSLPE